MLALILTGIGPPTAPRAEEAGPVEESDSGRKEEPAEPTARELGETEPGQMPLVQTDDVLVLWNGDRLTGDIKGLAQGLIRFKTDPTGTINVEWDYVVRLQSPSIYEV